MLHLPQTFVATIIKLEARAGIIFRIWQKSNDGNPPEVEVKVLLKTNNAFNSTGKKNKQTQKNIPFIAVSHKFT